MKYKYKISLVIATVFLAIFAFVALQSAYALVVTQTSGGGTATSTAPAKGTVLVGCSSTQYGPKPVGSNGQLLMASSTAPCGIFWFTPPYALGQYLTTSSASTTYVPYSGANANVALGAFGLTAKNLTTTNETISSTLSFPLVNASGTQTYTIANDTSGFLEHNVSGTVPGSGGSSTQPWNIDLWNCPFGTATNNQAECTLSQSMSFTDGSRVFIDHTLENYPGFAGWGEFLTATGGVGSSSSMYPYYIEFTDKSGNHAQPFSIGPVNSSTNSSGYNLALNNLGGETDATGFWFQSGAYLQNGGAATFAGTSFTASTTALFKATATFQGNISTTIANAPFTGTTAGGILQAVTTSTLKSYTDAFGYSTSSFVSPLNTTGSVLSYTGGTNVQILGSTDTVQRFLSATGNGTSAGLPSWQPFSNEGLSDFYFTASSSDLGSTLVASDTPYGTFSSTTDAGLTNGTTSLQLWATQVGAPGITSIPIGLIDVHVDAAQTAGTKPTFIYAVVNEINAAGTLVGQISQTESSSLLTNTLTDYDLVSFLTQPYVLASSTSRIQINVIASVSGALLTPTTQLYYGGTSADSRLELPASNVDATNFLPYVGATKNVNMGTFGLTAASLNASSVTISGFSGLLLASTSPLGSVATATLGTGLSLSGLTLSGVATTTITASGTTQNGPSFTFATSTQITPFASGTSLFWKFATTSISQFVNDAGYVTSTSGGGGLGTSSLGSYAPGNISFFLTSSTVSATSGLNFATSTNTLSVTGGGISSLSNLSLSGRTILSGGSTQDTTLNGSAGSIDIGTLGNGVTLTSQSSISGGDLTLQALGPHGTTNIIASGTAGNINLSATGGSVIIPNNNLKDSSGNAYVTSTAASATTTITASGTTLNGPTFTFSTSSQITPFASGTALFWKFATTSISQFANDSGYISSSTGNALYLQISSNLSDLNNTSTARNNIGIYSANGTFTGQQTLSATTTASGGIVNASGTHIGSAYTYLVSTVAKEGDFTNLPAAVAADCALPSPGKIFVKSGTYALGTSTLQIPGTCSGGALIFENESTTAVTYSGTGFAINLGETSSSLHYFELGNFSLFGTASATGAIYAPRLQVSHLHNIQIKGFSAASTTFAGQGKGIVIDGLPSQVAADNNIEDIHFEGNDLALSCINNCNANQFIGIDAYGQTNASSALLFVASSSVGNKFQFQNFSSATNGAVVLSAKNNIEVDYTELLTTAFTFAGSGGQNYVYYAQMANVTTTVSDTTSGGTNQIFSSNGSIINTLTVNNTSFFGNDVVVSSTAGGNTDFTLNRSTSTDFASIHFATAGTNWVGLQVKNNGSNGDFQIADEQDGGLAFFAQRNATTTIGNFGSGTNVVIADAAIASTTLTVNQTTTLKGNISTTIANAPFLGTAASGIIQPVTTSTLKSYTDTFGYSTSTSGAVSINGITTSSFSFTAAGTGLAVASSGNNIAYTWTNPGYVTAASTTTWTAAQTYTSTSTFASSVVATGGVNIFGGGGLVVTSTGNGDIHIWRGTASNFASLHLGTAGTDWVGIQLKNSGTEGELQISDEQDGGLAFDAKRNGTTTIGNFGSGTNVQIATTLIDPSGFKYSTSTGGAGGLATSTSGSYTPNNVLLTANSSTATADNGLSYATGTQNFALLIQNGSGVNMFTVSSSSVSTAIGSFVASGTLQSNGASTFLNSLTQSGGLAVLASTTINGFATTTNLNITATGTIASFLSLGGQFYSQKTLNNITNTTTASMSLVNTSTAYGTPTIPANFLLAGDTIHFKIGGVQTANTGNYTFTVRLNNATTVLAAAAFTPTAHTAGFGFDIDGEFTVLSTGATGAVGGDGKLSLFTTASGLTSQQLVATSTGQATSSINTTIANTLGLVLTMATASTTNSVTTTIAEFDILRAQ